MFNSSNSKTDQLKNFIKNYKIDFLEFAFTHIDVADLQQILDQIKSSTGVSAKPDEDPNIKVGNSKFGGKPDLLADKYWPISNGQHMVFCAQ